MGRWQMGIGTIQAQDGEDKGGEIDVDLVLNCM